MKKKLFLLCLFISILFMPLGISANEQTKTYKFYDIENKLVATQKIHEGDILSYVNVPKTIENKRFVGWFLDGTKFDDFGKKISLDNKKEAIIKALYEDAIYIRYHDALGNILKTEEVTKNSTVNIAKDYPLVEAITLTTKHDGWSLIKGGLTDVSGSFDITDKSIDLYPIIKEGYWISFQTNSEASIAKQFIDIKDAVKKVKKPNDPYKKGYSFTKWYEDEALTKEYDFNAEVTKPLTLYAGYEVGKTTYQVRYYYEYQKEIKNNKWDYKLIAKEYREGITGTKAEYDADLVFTKPYKLNEKGYELDIEKTVDMTINADGTTIYNIYYKAKLSNIVVTTRRSRMSRYGYSGVIPGVDKYFTKEYTNIKYKQNIQFIWDDLNKLGIIDYMKEHDLKFRGTNNWLVDQDIYILHTYGDLELEIEKNERNYYTEVYAEVLDGKAPEGKTKEKNKSVRGKEDNRDYYLFDKGSNLFYGRYRWIAKNKFHCGPGYTLMPDLSDGHNLVLPSGEINFYAQDEPDKDVNRAYDENGNLMLYKGKDNPLRVYIIRNKFNIIFESNGASKIDDVKDIPYERNIKYLYNSNFIEDKTMSTIDGKEVVFAGWYTDAELTDKFDFNIEMPAHNITLYAKWKPRKYTVKFNTNGGTNVETKENIEYGETIDEPVTKKDGYIFLGWLYNNKPFNFASGITEDMTLNAEWKSIKAYKVTYDLNGGKGVTPLDNDNYYAGAGAIVLKHDDITAPLGKVFIGWGLDDNIYYPNHLAEVKEGEIVLKAMWKDKYKETGDLMPNTGVKSKSLQSLIFINLMFLGLALCTYKLKNNN